MNGLDEIKLDVAILGGGFAGVYCAKALLKQLGRNSTVKVGLIAEENYMVFQPMLPEVAGGSVSPRHVINPLRLLCEGANVFKGKVERIDWPNRKLTLDAGPFTGSVEIHYEHLVLALGAVVDLSRIPGMPEHAFLMQNVGDAMLLRSTIISRIEEAHLERRPDFRRRLLSFVVVGGGYSGVETAGQILDLFRTIHIYYPGISEKDLEVCLVHSRDHLLPTLSRGLGEYSARVLKERGLKLLLNARVKSVTANKVYLDDGSSIDTSTVISTVGNAPHPLIIRLCDENGLGAEKGKILADPTCQVKGQTRLWAAGDCAAIPFVKGGYCPDTAQFAMRQGALLGKNIARAIRKHSLQPFTFKGLGELASIGHHVAVADVFGFRFSGFFAWWLWRSVYLMKLPRLDRKLRVVIDWTLDLFFPRDINLLSPRYTALLKEIYLEKGDVLFRKGEPAFSFYIVKKGALRIEDEKGAVRTIHAGEYFGERALLEDQIWHFNSVALDPTVLVSIPARIFHQIVRGSGSLGRLFQKSATRYQSREIIAAATERIPEPVRSRKAREIMTTELETLQPDMTVREALAVTKGRPHSSYPVVDATGKLLGVVHREDFYEFIKNHETTPGTPLHRMTLSSLPAISPEETVEEIMRQLIRSGSNKLLVADGEGKLLGIVTVMDLITASQESPFSTAE